MFVGSVVRYGSPSEYDDGYLPVPLADGTPFLQDFDANEVKYFFHKLADAHAGVRRKLPPVVTAALQEDFPVLSASAERARVRAIRKMYAPLRSHKKSDVCF